MPYTPAKAAKATGTNKTMIPRAIMPGKIVGFGIVVFATLLGAAAAYADSGPTGIWQTQAGDARVKVSKCGDGLCGVIVSMRDKIESGYRQGAGR